jgi:hypothetical protein
LVVSFCSADIGTPGLLHARQVAIPLSPYLSFLRREGVREDEESGGKTVRRRARQILPAWTHSLILFFPVSSPQEVQRQCFWLEVVTEGLDTLSP